MVAFKPSPKTLSLKIASFIFAGMLEENLQHSTLPLHSVVTERWKEAGWNAAL
jgi:hypothetical protein